MVFKAPHVEIQQTKEVTTVTINPEFGNVTGTKDKDYDIIWFTEACLSNVLRLETYIRFLPPRAAREPQRG